MKRLMRSAAIAALAMGAVAYAEEAKAPAQNVGPCDVGPHPGPLSQADAVKLLKTFEERTQAPGDLKSVIDVEVKRANASTISQQMLTLRRDAQNQFIVLLSAPKTEAGKGYLYRDKNFWFYDPSVGRWERRTERDRIGGTNARRSDLAPRRDTDNYAITSAPDEKVERSDARVLVLNAKPGADVAYAKAKYWVDAKTGYVIKGVGCSESGALISSFLTPRWNVAKTPDGKTVAMWSELHVYDEVSKGDSTHIRVKALDLSPLPTETFSKAWLESKSR